MSETATEPTGASSRLNALLHGSQFIQGLFKCRDKVFHKVFYFRKIRLKKRLPGLFFRRKKFVVSGKKKGKKLKVSVRALMSKQYDSWSGTYKKRVKIK